MLSNILVMFLCLSSFHLFVLHMIITIIIIVINSSSMIIIIILKEEQKDERENESEGLVLVLYLKLLFSFRESTKESLNLFAAGIFILRLMHVMYKDTQVKTVKIFGGIAK